MSTGSVSDLAAGGTGVLGLLRLFSMTPPLQHPSPLSSPTMPPSSRSEKLLRDALLRDDRERQQLSSPSANNPPITPPAHQRRHSHAPASSYSASASTTREDYTRGSFLFRTAMSNPRSPSPSSSQDKEDRDREGSPIRRMLFYGGDAEVQRRPSQSQGHQQQQQITTPYRYHTRRSSVSPSPSPSSASTSPSPSPLHMRERQEGLGQTSPNTNTTNNHNTSNANKPPTNVNRYGSAQSSQLRSLGQGQSELLQLTPQEQALRARLERSLDENEVRDEQGGWPWKRGRQSGSGSRSASMISASINKVITTSSSASASNSNSSHAHSHSMSQSQLGYPQTPQSQTRTHYPLSSTTPNRTTQNATINNQRSPYYSPSSPRTPLSAPGRMPGGIVTGYSPSHTRSRSQTDPNPHPPLSRPRLSPNSNSPKSNATFASPSATTKGESVRDLRLPTPPPTPPMTLVSLGSVGSAAGGGSYIPSPYKTGTVNPSPSGSGTPTRIPVRTQTQKKEAGLEMRRPTQGPASAATVGGNKEKEKGKEPLRPLDFSSISSRQGGPRQRDVTVTQQSLQARIGPKKSNNTDGHSLASTESRSTRTSGSSALHSHSHSHIGCASVSGYCACSHSSLDGPQLPFAGDMYAQSVDNLNNHPHVHVSQSQSQSIPPSSPSPTIGTKPFNARKASTQCRAIQGYVSFASVEGLGEPPSLVGDEFDDGDEFGEGEGGRRGKGNAGGVGRGVTTFLPLSVWGTALGWKRFLGVGGGVEVQEQGVVV